MTTLTLAPLSLDTVRVKSSKPRKAVPVGHVQHLLREIVIALHATRTIGTIDRDEEMTGSDE